MLEMPRVREVFEASKDFTVGLEEEFAILDPRTLSLDQLGRASCRERV